MISYTYRDLRKLVEACKQNDQRGLACLLTKECIRPHLTNQIDEGGGEWDVPRSELTKDKVLVRGNFGIVYQGNLVYTDVQYI